MSMRMAVIMVAGFFLTGFISTEAARAQDTLFFRDGSYSVGRLPLPVGKQIHFVQLAENGDSAVKTEKLASLDSVHFQNGQRFVKGKCDSATVPDAWLPVASFFSGKKAGEKNTSITKAFVATGYLSGLLVAGLPFSLYQATKPPSLEQMHAGEARLYHQNKDFASGYRKGMNQTRLKAILPIYLAGLLTGMLGLAVLLPR